MYLEGSQVEFSRSLMYFALIMANNEDPDEMQHYAAFHLGLHCLPRYPFRVSRIQKVKMHLSRGMRFPTMCHFDKSLCGLLLSLETQNDVRSVA